MQLPKTLAMRMARVTRARYLKWLASFKAERARVVRILQRRGLTNAAIAKLLGVTHQYMDQTYPRPLPQKEQTK